MCSLESLWVGLRVPSWDPHVIHHSNFVLTGKVGKKNMLVSLRQGGGGLARNATFVLKICFGSGKQKRAYCAILLRFHLVQHMKDNIAVMHWIGLIILGWAGKNRPTWEVNPNTSLHAFLTCFKTRHDRHVDNFETHKSCGSQQFHDLFPPHRG